MRLRFATKDHSMMADMTAASTSTMLTACSKPDHLAWLSLSTYMSHLEAHLIGDSCKYFTRITSLATTIEVQVRRYISCMNISLSAMG
jgi:hypothetical protein